MSNAFMIEHDALTRVAAVGWRGAAEAVAYTWERNAEHMVPLMVAAGVVARAPLAFRKWIIDAGSGNATKLPPAVEFTYDDAFVGKRPMRRYKGRIEGCQDWIEVERVIL